MSVSVSPLREHGGWQHCGPSRDGQTLDPRLPPPFPMSTSLTTGSLRAPTRQGQVLGEHVNETKSCAGRSRPAHWFVHASCSFTQEIHMALGLGRGWAAIGAPALVGSVSGLPWREDRDGAGVPCQGQTPGAGGRPVWPLPSVAPSGWVRAGSSVRVSFL